MHTGPKVKMNAELFLQMADLTHFSLRWESFIDRPIWVELMRWPTLFEGASKGGDQKHIKFPMRFHDQVLDMIRNNAVFTYNLPGIE